MNIINTCIEGMRLLEWEACLVECRGPACLNVACSGGFLDAFLSATLSSVLLKVGGSFYRPVHYNTVVGRYEYH